MVMDMKIGFVHLGRENLGIEYLSSVTKQHGHEVVLYYDPGIFGQNDNVFYIPRLESLFDRKEWLIKQIVDEKPDLLCFSVYTTTFAWALDLAEKVRPYVSCPIVFGGIHVTLAPEIILQYPQIDLAMAGEGEAAFPEMLEAVAGNRTFASVKNLIYRENGRIIQNELRDPIADLDSLPLPDKALFEKDVNFKDDYLVMTNRGCPFSCAYCCESAINKIYNNRFFRRRSTKSVIDELSVMLDRYQYREVMFNDSIFFTHKDWLFELLDEYRARIRRPFRCFGQVKFLTDDIADALVRSGCYAIEFGVQTMNETLRKNLLNRKESNEDNAKAFAICDRHKIHYDVDHIFGLPTETEQDYFFAARFYATLKYLNRIKCHFLLYFPSTPLLATGKELNILTDRDLANINAGNIGDFFHDGRFADENRRILAGHFTNLLKILPLLPAVWVEKILDKGWYKKIGKIPKPVTIGLQVVNAFKGRDYRFFVYIKYYFKRLRRSWPAFKYNRRLKADKPQA